MPKPFSLQIDTAKNFFFDGDVVRSFIDEATRKGLSRIGAFTRRRARSSLRRRKKVSQPGAPPSTHTPGSQNLKFILFAFDAPTRSVVVGPVAFNGGEPGIGTAELHEKGGMRRIVRKSQRGQRTSTHMASYPPRPYMVPAALLEAPKAPDEIRKAGKHVLVRKARRNS